MLAWDGAGAGVGAGAGAVDWFDSVSENREVFIVSFLDGFAGLINSVPLTPLTCLLSMLSLSD